MRPTAAASSSSSKAAGKEKIRRKGGGASDQLLTDHVLSLRARLHDALALGLTRSDGQGVKKWQSTDAGIQFHALKAMASFIGSLSNEMLRLPPVKDSISDILIALEGVLQTKNVPVLIHATEVCLKLISSLGNSIRQYPIVDIVTSLSYQLSTEHVPISITCASAMNCILNNLVTARASTNAEIWEALEKTKAIESIISVLQSYAHDVYPLNNLIEMISLLRIILWIWPSSRYFVWSNCNFMRKLEQYCLSTEMAVSANVLKLYAALALCGNGAMVLLKNEGLITSIGELMRESQPSVTRIEALKLCQVLLRSSKGCKLLMNSHCQLTVQGIINAMSTSDEKYLVTEGCRTALLLVRYAGNHHRYFWSNAIDEVLYTILTGSCISSHQAHQILCHNKLFDIVTKNIMDIHCYVWDILGHLVVNCNNEYFSLGKGNIYFLQALISCACSLATDVVQKSSSIKLTKDQQEPALRAVLMMLLSPCGYISSEASSNFLQVLHLAVISGRCPKLLPSAKSLDGDGKHTDEWGRSFRCIRISDRVDSRALKKIVEYTYSGFVLVDDDIVKPVRTLAKYCHLNSLHEMLEKEQPRWNSAYTKYDLTAALEPVEYSFLDIILEAQSNEEMKCQHSSCQLSSPHVHSHKIVLSRNCHYFRALFQSGMHESFSDVIKVPLGRDALDKLIQWFYSGELPKVAPDCRWKNLSKGEQLSHLRPYVELSSLAEFWLLEEVKEESLAVVTSCLSRSTTAAIEFIAAAAELGQWEMVDAGVRSVAHLYPKLRDSGKLEQLEEGLLDMVRTEYVRYSQSHHVPGRCK